MTPEQRRELGLESDQLARGTFLANDPAVEHPAFAVFHLGKLVRAQRVKLPAAWAKLDAKGRYIGTGERCARIARLVYEQSLDVVRQNIRLPIGRVFNAVVVELPQHYTAAKSKGDPNSLQKLALVAQGIAVLANCPVLSPHPDDWCALPKLDKNGKPYEDPRESPKGRLIWKRLRPDEQAVCELTHDALDAAGVGAWALDRLDRVLVGTT